MLGKEVRTLVDEVKPAGLIDVWWDGKTILVIKSLTASISTDLNQKILSRPGK